MVTSFLLTGLEEGTYTVFINKNNGDASGNGNEGCQAFATFTIGSDPNVLTVNPTTGITVVDNDNCSPADGSITIDEIIIDGVATPLVNASPYTINWTSTGTGVVGTSNAGVSIANDQLTGVDAGTYTFNITHNTTGCSTGSIDVVVDDIQINPVISLNTSGDDTYCDGTNNTGDGSITIDITEDGGSAITLADYSIEWYRGTFTSAPGTGDANFLHDDAGSASGGNVGSALVGGDIRSLTGLEEGTYTVFINKNNGDASGNGNEGCQAFATFTIGSDPNVLTVSPTTGITVVDNDNCTPADGSITIDEIIIDGVATPLVNASPYTINWTSTGTGVVGTSNAGVSIANDQLTGVDAGTYTFNITHNTTGCSTGSIDVVVDDIQVNPVVSLNTSGDDTYCDGTNNTGDGSITIDITEDGGSAITLADYSVEWYRGTFTSAPGTGNANFLHDDAGSASGGNVGSVLVGGDIRSLTGLEEGTYTVFINKNNGDASGNGNEGCQAFATFTIGSDPNVLTVSPTTGITVVDNDNCSPADGSITIDEIIIDGVATPLVNASPYTINWTSTGTGVVGTSNAGVSIANDQLTGVDAGTYTFNITHNTTGCSTGSIDVVVDDIQVNPVISLNTSGDDTYCDGTNNTGDGSITIDITEDGGSAITLADYSVEWYRGTFTSAPGTGNANFLHDDAGSASGGNVGSALVGGDIRSLTGLEEGTYTVFINKNNGDASGNGNEGCQAFATFTIGSDPNVLTVSPTTGITVVDNDNCTPADGSITIDEIIIDGVATPLVNASPYTINWTSTGTGVVGTSNAGVSIANDQLTGVDAGTYTFNITHNTTGCSTGSIDVVVDDIQINPVISLNTSGDDTYCDGTNNTGDGSITIDITEDGGSAITLADYSVEWYRGTFTSAPGTGNANFLHDDAGSASGGNVGSALVGGDIRSLTGLEEGTYTVFINKNNGDASGNGNEGCQAFATFTIGSDPNVLTVSPTTGITVVDNDNCSPADGSITIDEIIIDGVATPLVNASPYTINWTSTGTGVVGTSNAGVSIANDQLTGVDAGTYTFNITHNTTGCSTGSIDVVVDDIQINPVISLNTSGDDTYCDGTNNTGDGSITIDITEDGGSAITLADYSVEWYRGTFTSAPGTGNANFLHDDAGSASGGNVGSALVGGDIRSLTGLEEGTYTVFINKNNGDASGNGNEGCQAFATFTIGSDPNVLTVSPTTGITVVDNDNCSPANGSITIDEIIVDGVQVALVNASPYTINWTSTGSGNIVTTNAGVSIANDRLEDLDAGTYTFNITHNTTGCTTGSIDVVVEDVAVNPVVNASTISEDTYCDNTGFVGDGSITISITEDGAAATLANYSVEWYRGTFTTAPGTADDDFLADESNATGTNSGNTNAGDAVVGVDIATLNGLGTGDYTVFVTKDLGGSGNIGCTTFATFNVGSMDDIPTIDDVTIQANAQPDSLCVGNSGTIIINDADIEGTLNDYEVIIRQGSESGPVSGTFTNNGSPTISLGSLSADNYFIFAQNTTTGCFATTAVVNVEDSVRNPQVALISMTPDQDCGGGVNAGGLEVLVDQLYDHTNQTFLTFDWTQTSSGLGVNGLFGATQNEAVLSGVPADDYTVTVTNGNTGCSISRTYTITNVETYPSIISISTVDNTTCDDDNDNIPVDAGSFEVTEISFDGTSLNQAAMAGNYTLSVFEMPAMTAVADNDGATPFLFGELASGDYRAIITKDDSDCSSNGLDFTIEDIVVRPIVTIALVQADSTCSASGTPNGSLRATAEVGGTSGIDDTDPDYNFNWYQGSGIGTDLGITTSTISGIAAGTYTVRVERISTGCVTLEEFELPNVPTEVEILTVDATPATACNGNGIIEVTSVSRDNVSDYTFEFYDSDPTTGGTVVFTVPTDGATFDTAMGGTTYYIIGTNNIVGCTTPVFEIEVEENFTYPVRTGLSFNAQSNCDPSNPNGSLTVEYDGVTPAAPDYTVQWYFGNDTSNPLDQGDIGGAGTLSGETTATVSGIPAGTYTVEVTNTNTGCSSTDTFDMIDDIPNPVEIAVSSSANTNCVNPNGIVSVFVISPPPGRALTDYNYYWFQGDLATVGASPDPINASYTGSIVENLADGDYVVLVIDQVDTFCQSVATEVTIDDGTTNPLYTLETSNVTVCFDDKDGYATVSAPDLSVVDIEWLDDDLNVIGNTFFVDSLDAGLYTINLTHVITGCVATEVFEIGNDAITPNSPFVLVNSGRTNCSFANGNAIANVDGITTNFLFEWFDPNDLSTPYTTGSQVFNLDTTTYLVRATDLTTGCSSAFTQVDIGYEVVDPAFQVLAENSICLRTEDGAANQFTGTATISFDQFNLATNYEWIDLADGEVVGTDARLIDALPGDYGVRFTADNGCEYYAEFTIETQLNIYNGVSANNDGNNDFFLIDCINFFPNNTVQIFSRTGQKIYEAEGYNNTSVRFDGAANAGIRVGTALPAGTYYYIVDLGTGEDPIQGFLELVR